MFPCIHPITFVWAQSRLNRVGAAHPQVVSPAGRLLTRMKVDLPQWTPSHNSIFGHQMAHTATTHPEVLTLATHAMQTP